MTGLLNIFALEREDPDYEPDFVIEYRKKIVIPKIEQYQSEKNLPKASIRTRMLRRSWRVMAGPSWVSLK